MTLPAAARKIDAWHFCLDRAGTPVLYGHGKTDDPDALVVAPGYIYTTDEPVIKACESGLHASRTVRDALQYAQSGWLCRVRCWGEIDEQSDKLAARHREVISVRNVERELRLWACWCARNTPLGNGRTTWDLMTDPRSRAAVECAERHANGQATDAELAAAWAAAWAAARAAARDAARDAARAAAWNAARDAAIEFQSAELERRMRALLPKGVK